MEMMDLDLVSSALLAIFRNLLFILEFIEMVVEF